VNIFEGACPNCRWFLEKFFRVWNTRVHPRHISNYSREDLRPFMVWRPWQRPGCAPLRPALSPKVRNVLFSKAQTDVGVHQVSYTTMSIGRYFPLCKAASGVACKNPWSCSPFPTRLQGLHNDEENYSSKFRSLKKTTIRCFEMSRSDYPVTQHHISERQNL
jgi:hypothetical protein